MAKAGSKKSGSNNSSMKRLGIIGGALVLVAVLFPGGETTPLKKGKGNFQFAAGGGTSTKKKTDTYEKEDYTAQFASLESEMKNGFRPLIAKKSADSSMTPLASNGIPAAFASGEPNWVYTGNMAVNSVPNALLENTQSGEGVFLRPGERWKALILKEVRQDSIVLEGPSGFIKTVFFASQSELSPMDPVKSGVLPPATAGTNPGAATNPAAGTNANNPANSEQNNSQDRRRRRRDQANSGSNDFFGPIGANGSQLTSPTTNFSETNNSPTQNSERP